MNLENSSQDKLEAWSQSTGMSMNLPTDATASSAGACPFRTYNHSQSLPVGHYDTSKSERKWYRDAMKSYNQNGRAIKIWMKINY
ncbi:unnamed protein product [Allacma fusca]|uniref:Uncharacterized protein n=1 Tax=Allacma fusca TaxID=39272 RepID=A0A8J2J0I4_9HEXA|nr:unnamed protein product [Allacma fusca]